MQDPWNPPLTRRALLRNALAYSALGAVLWRAPRLWGSTQLTQESAPPYLLVVHCDGGWDATMTLEDKSSNSAFDSESGAAAAKGKNKIPYVDHPDRPSVKTFFDTYGDGALIVNGLYSKTLTHEEGALFSSSSFHESEQRYIDWLTYYASQVAPTKAVPHLVVEAPYQPGPYARYAYKMPADWFTTAPTSVLNGDKALSPDEESALTTYLMRAYQTAVNTHVETTDLQKLHALLGGFTQSPAIQKELATFSAGTESQSWVTHGKFAIQSFKDGISHCATIQAGRAGLWDTHRDHYAAQSTAWEMLFAGLLHILDAISQAGLQDQVILLVKSDIGRYPKLNADKGKDHWPYTSALLWGHPILGGTAFGSTDKNGIAHPIDPTFGGYSGNNLVTLTLEHVLAGIFTRYGIAQTAYTDQVPPEMAQIRKT